MSDTILKQKDIEDLFQSLTTRMLGLATKDINLKPINQDRVRVSWPTGGAPAWKITEDIVFLRVNNADAPITRQRETEYAYNNLDVHNAKRTTSYTRVRTVNFILYGPNSFDNADVIRNGLYLPEYREELAKKNLFMILDVPMPIRFPELFNGQWWERTDFTVSFNELVKRQGTVPWIKSTNIKLYTEKGEVK